jgi:hypothetical protein
MNREVSALEDRNQASEALSLIENTMHVVPALIHIKPYQAYIHTQDKKCHNNQAVASYKPPLPEYHAKMHFAHLVDEGTNYERQQPKEQTE